MMKPFLSASGNPRLGIRALTKTFGTLDMYATFIAEVWAVTSAGSGPESRITVQTKQGGMYELNLLFPYFCKTHVFIS